MASGYLNGATENGPATEPNGSGLPARRSAIDLSKLDGRRALGERITIRGRVLDEHRLPVPDTMIRIWQTNSAGRYQYTGHQSDAPLDPNFRGNGIVHTDEDGWFQMTTIMPGSYAAPEASDVLQPNHIHYVLSGPRLAQRVFADMYFPGDPLLLLDEPSATLPQSQEICLFDRDLTTPELGRGYRFDVTIGGSGATPFADVEKRHNWVTS
jgi:protocatechuate 3,4-dioxygenase, beta subunit